MISVIWNRPRVIVSRFVLLSISKRLIVCRMIWPFPRGNFNFSTIVFGSQGVESKCFNDFRSSGSIIVKSRDLPISSTSSIRFLSSSSSFIEHNRQRSIFDRVKIDGDDVDDILAAFFLLPSSSSPLLGSSFPQYNSSRCL